MRNHHRSLVAWLLALAIVTPWPASAQTRALSESECQELRQKLAEHARLSEGVRRALKAGITGPAVAARPDVLVEDGWSLPTSHRYESYDRTSGAYSPLDLARVPSLASRGAWIFDRTAGAWVVHPSTGRNPQYRVGAAAESKPAAGRPDAIRARLGEIQASRQQLEDQRLAAVVKLEFTRAGEIQERISALDRERTQLEKELAAQPAAQPGTDVDRVTCQDLPAAHTAAVRIRQKELGAREGQAGVLPLLGLRGQTGEQITRELAAQFAAWPEAATQVGLLDVDGDGRLDAFVDVPLKDVFRLHRQRGDGAFSVEVFALPGRNAAAEYGDLARRLDETAARHAGWTLADWLATRPAGSVRVVGETTAFATAHAHLLAGNFAEAGRLDGPAARSLAFENLRGETTRVLEVIAPSARGVTIRRVLVSGRPNDEEQWEESTAVVSPVSIWRADVELTASRQTRKADGAPVGARTTRAPLKATLER